MNLRQEKFPWFQRMTPEQRVIYLTRIGILQDAKGCDETITKEQHQMAYREAMAFKEEE